MSCSNVITWITKCLLCKVASDGLTKITGTNLSALHDIKRKENPREIDGSRVDGPQNDGATTLAGAAIRHVNRRKGSGSADSPRKRSVSAPLLSASPQYPSKRFHTALRPIDSWTEGRFVEEVKGKERKRGQRGREGSGEGNVEGNEEPACNREAIRSLVIRCHMVICTARSTN